MKENFCKYEQTVLKESKTINQNKELFAHVSQCANCREALKLAGWMHAFASASQPKNLPKPGFIRWKANIVEKQKTAERATQPIEWAQAITVMLVSATVFWLLIQNSNQFGAGVNVLLASFELIAIPLLIVSTCAAFICLLIAYKWREPSRRK
jgi:hypothetical protein